MEKITVEYQQIAYFPYVFMGTNPIEYEGVTIWNFSREAERRIPDQSTRAFIASLLQINVRRGQPIPSIGVVDLSAQGFKPFNPKQKKLIQEFRLALFLCTVAQSNIYSGPNAGLQMVTADNFTLIFQNFQLGNFSAGFSTGSIVRIRSGGGKISEAKHEKPPYVFDHASIHIDEALMACMAKVKKRKPRAYQRILRAVEAFMGGYFNSDEMSFEGRILQQARAFEILLDLPPGRTQRMVAKEKIEKFCSPDSAKKVCYRFERGHGQFEQESGTMQKKWTDRFFTLRNHIIHGQNVPESKLRFHGKWHQDLALWFFLVSLKKLVNQTLGEQEFYDEVKFEKNTFAYDSNAYYAILMRGAQKLKSKKVSSRQTKKQTISSMASPEFDLPSSE